MGQITASLPSDMSIISPLRMSHLSFKETEARTAVAAVKLHQSPLFVDPKCSLASLDVPFILTAQVGVEYF